MKINDYVKLIGEINKEKGWRDLDRRPLELHDLMHCEISEASEEVRKGMRPVYKICCIDVCEKNILTCKEKNCPYTKPEGEAVELIDAVIRIMDYFDMNGWDFEEILKMKIEYNKTRSFRHGGKLK